MTALSELSAEKLLETLNTGVLLVDPQTLAIRFANPVFREMCGPLADMLTERPLASLFRLDPQTRCPLCKGMPGADGDVHTAFLQIDGEELRVKVKHNRLPDGTQLLMVEPFSEDAALTQAHSDFVSTMSHEFRTPLTSIKGFADTLIKYGAQLPDEEKKRFITIIKDQADRLIRLVENLLTVSKLGAHRLQLSYRPVPLARQMEKVVESIQAKYPATKRQFDVTINPLVTDVWADADRLEQVLLNLVDNAFKYSRPDSKITIQADPLPEDESMIRIKIADQGVGIPEDKLPHIFTKFYRIETPLTQDVEGTGLGLYIVKSLVNAMGGQISVESESGKGTTFTLVFPAATPERQAAHRRRLTAEEGET